MTAKTLHPGGILLWTPFIVILAGAPVGLAATGGAGVANSSKAAANTAEQEQTPAPASGLEPTGAGQNALAAHAQPLSEYKAALATAQIELSEYSKAVEQARQTLAEYQRSIAAARKGMLIASIIGTAAAVFGGGLAGALVSAWLTRRRAKRDLTLTLLQQYLDQWSSKAVASAQDLEDGIALDDDAKMGAVKAVGDWLDTLGFLYKNGHTDKGLMKDTGFSQILREFREAVEKCCQTPDLAEDRKASADQLKEWLVSWKNLVL